MSSELAEMVDFASPNDGQELMQRVLQHELPPVLEDLVDEYVTLEGARNRFMWKWVHDLAPQNTLPSVPVEHQDKVATDKTITILYITLLDDLLEKHRDRTTFEEAAKLPFEHQTVNEDRPGVNVGYLDFSRQVWETLDERLRAAPEYRSYEHLFRYDLRQAINAIEYTNLVIDRPELATVQDLELYESHNMVMYAYLDIDLMHSEPRYESELPALRRALWPAQQMARIGNWLSTWERELLEEDYSSGIVVYALQHDIVSLEELQAISHEQDDVYEDVVDRIQQAGVEELFLTRWRAHREELVALNEHEIQGLDLTPFIEGLQVVLRYHLASRGLK